MSAVSLFMVTLIVPDMDDAIEHYTRDWGFQLANDSFHVSGHRWVEIDPGDGARLRLAEAANDEQRALIGRQTGGRVAFFLNVANFASTLIKWEANGVQIIEPERNESYGRVVVLQDKYGNRWDVFDAGDM